ncbi:MAG: LuxR family transcriptional regulator [Mesorhizobium sp.]|uniref:helix-turn-helix transcriptional regulator n=1 Tax=unclassified Mesorhizobium TaxID=325217 RepID=UPI000FD57335|nr:MULTISPECIES: helix-turn-helix transcriptional regulator [unclassified Mesorhizobium]RVD12411.1 LuxR family transcriptional regulator [Mesorhizobium sp. M7A.F.Ca.ET.027.02.1.1]RWC99384.1 MAG: LuxR family transcriptional regulator [Mesorhizobium sp.]RWP85861.1 MAG: LuxR family transcriptional regulator [Mesorhizobium sp.]
MQSNISLDRFGHWSGGVAAAAMAATPEELSARFTAAASGLLGSDRAYVGFYRRDITSLTIDDAGPDRWNRDYDARLYRQDPFFQRFASTRQDFLLPLSALRNGDFQRTPYYREFFGPSDSFDEITGVFNLDGLTAGYVTFLRRNGAPAFGDQDLEMACAASSATRLILQRLLHLCRSRDKGAAIGDGRSGLSRREAEVARHLVEGGNAKTISRSLAVSPGTVRNHIKQIYRKLGVHSQVELLAAFREAA